LKILVLEPYFGGSHALFLKGLQEHLPYEFDLLTMPARKWKWRMRLAGPYFAEQLNNQVVRKQYDCILCSTFVDVAAFRSLVKRQFQQIPLYTYFHENQFAYPVQIEDERDFHFGLTNLTTALASDKLGFNTQYNLQTFLTGVEQILKICPDMKLAGTIDKINKRASILYPGVDFSGFPGPDTCTSNSDSTPIIVWNHRWEHDKNPEYFFETLYELDKQNVDFRLLVMGQSFQRQPEIFAEAQEKLAHKIDHFGFVESREDYIRQLCRADIVISTATHEFYGISVIEAVRTGCIPLLPKRLSYPELFPAEYLYKDGELFSRLKSLLQDAGKQDRSCMKPLTDNFSWPVLEEKYQEWFEGNSI
jgi:glycosyltransferase involved in cell wall biosynthesis